MGQAADTGVGSLTRSKRGVWQWSRGRGWSRRGQVVQGMRQGMRQEAWDGAADLAVEQGFGWESCRG